MVICPVLDIFSDGALVDPAAGKLTGALAVVVKMAAVVRPSVFTVKFCANCVGVCCCVIAHNILKRWIKIKIRAIVRDNVCFLSVNRYG